MSEVNKVNQFIEKVIDWLETSSEFVYEQLPLVLQEFWLWHIWSSIFYIVLGIGLILIGRYVPHLWAIEKYDSNRHNEKFFGRGSRARNEISYEMGPAASAWLFFISFTLVGAVIILVNTYSLIKISVAPKIYLLEYLQSMI